MHYRNLRQCLILSLPKAHLNDVRALVSQLTPVDESAESVDCIMEHRPMHDDLFSIELLSGGSLSVVCGQKHIHLLLWKGKGFEKLKRKVVAWERGREGRSKRR